MAPEAAYRAERPSSSTGAALVWLGHSTVLVELDGVRLLTDPVLRNRVGPLVRIAPHTSPSHVGTVDCVLLSHLHADHADVPTLHAVRRTGAIIAPASAERWLAGRGLGPVRELSAGETFRVGSVTVTAVHALHDGRRWPFGPAPAPVGFVIRGSSSIYFAGDTDLFAEMADLRGSVDVALLPVWGWGPSVGPGHLDPHRAAQAAALIAPALAVPIHWGTFALPHVIRSQTDPVRPARDFAAAVHGDAPDIEVRVLAPGSATEF